jgi:hypothetical protein
MASLAQFIKHGELYGGYRDLREVARKELHALELGKLAKALRGMPARHRGGDGPHHREALLAHTSRAVRTNRTPDRRGGGRSDHPRLCRCLAVGSRRGP